MDGAPDTAVLGYSQRQKTVAMETVATRLAKATDSRAAGAAARRGFLFAFKDWAGAARED